MSDPVKLGDAMAGFLERFKDRPVFEASEVARPKVYQCDVCKDVGWVYRDVKPPHPDYLKLLRCPMCGQERDRERAARLSGLSDDMRDIRFSNSVRTKANQGALEAAERLAVDPRWIMTLVGPNGRGKTHILCALVNEVVESGGAAVYMTATALLDHLRRGYRPGADLEFDEVWERLIEARVLAIDEIAAWNPTSWAEEKFRELIDERYRLGRDRLTALALDMPLENLPGWLLSRIQDRRCVVCELTGSDLRKLRK